MCCHFGELAVHEQLLRILELLENHKSLETLQDLGVGHRGRKLLLGHQPRVKILFLVVFGPGVDHAILDVGDSF